MKKYHPKAWLWWLAMFILILGGAIAYFLSQQKVNPDARKLMSITVLLTLIGTGICVISATADRWIQR
ncbi:MAG: hypothetical protein KJ626_09505 [Verrucomicrobia bacterium]|nr:hypothetical protein [Verrucomicrobiota bacterium]